VLVKGVKVHGRREVPEKEPSDSGPMCDEPPV